MRDTPRKHDFPSVRAMTSDTTQSPVGTAAHDVLEPSAADLSNNVVPLRWPGSEPGARTRAWAGQVWGRSVLLADTAPDEYAECLRILSGEADRSHRPVLVLVGEPSAHESLPGAEAPTGPASFVTSSPVTRILVAPESTDPTALRRASAAGVLLVGYREGAMSSPASANSGGRGTGSGRFLAVRDSAADALWFASVVLSHLPPAQGRPGPRYRAESLAPDVFERARERRGSSVSAALRDLTGDDWLPVASPSPRIVAGLGRIAGRSVGFVMSEPLVSRVFDHAALRAVVRFLAFADAYGIPVVWGIDASVVDLPGTPVCPGPSDSRESFTELERAEAEDLLDRLDTLVRSAGLRLFLATDPGDSSGATRLVTECGAPLGAAEPDVPLAEALERWLDGLD